MRVLAIDPGYDRLGLAVLEGDASKPTVVWSECVIPPKGEPQERLEEVSRATKEAIETYAPDVVAIEKLYFSTNNKRSALGVAEARGAILVAIEEAGLKVAEYSPQTVKFAVTGHGAADKKAVMRMVPMLVTLSPKKRLDDEFDAIALGIAALADKYPH